MISTPTLLSVAGPVTAHGSMPNRSRSIFTPPHAATGSFADSTTPVSAVADVRALEDRVDAVGAEDAVAQLEHDDVRLAVGELGEHGARERRADLRGGRDDAEVREDQRVARAGIFHRQDVAAQRDARGLERIDDEAAMAHAA